MPLPQLPTVGQLSTVGQGKNYKPMSLSLSTWLHSTLHSLTCKHFTTFSDGQYQK